jgi:hypothetical protein
MTRIDSSGAGLEYKGFPYKEGDDYYTIEGSQVVWSCWDCESEAMYTEAVAKGKLARCWRNGEGVAISAHPTYFDFEGDAQEYMFIKLKEEYENQHLDVQKATDVARCCIVGDGEESRIAEYLEDGTGHAVLKALTNAGQIDWQLFCREESAPAEVRVNREVVYAALDKLDWTKTPFIWNKYLLSKDQETWIAVVTGLDVGPYMDTWYQDREKTSRCLKVTLCAEREMPEGEWAVDSPGNVMRIYQRYEDAVAAYERLQAYPDEGRPLTAKYLLDHLRKLEREHPNQLDDPVTVAAGGDRYMLSHVLLSNHWVPNDEGERFVELTALKVNGEGGKLSSRIDDEQELQFRLARSEEAT